MLGVSYMNDVLPFCSIVGQILWICGTSLDVSLLISCISFLAYPFFSSPLTCSEKLFLTGVVVGLCWSCPNHLKWISLNLSTIDATLKCSQMHLFFILSCLTTCLSRHLFFLSLSVISTSLSCYTHFLNVYWPTFHSMGHIWFNCHFIHNRAWWY